MIKKNKITTTFFLSCTLLIITNALANEQETMNTKLIPAFVANYTVLHKSDPVGTATRELSYQANGSIKYQYQTHVEWFIFSQTRSETSILTIENNQITPQHYKYTREGTGKDKHSEWLYKAKENIAEDLIRNKNLAIDFSHNLQDKLSYHLQNRVDLIKDASKSNYTYSVISTSGSVKDYIYQYDGKENLTLPYGLVKTIRFKREIKQKKRVTYAWFAPELNYLLVKLHQVKAGSEQFEAQLSSLKIKDSH